MHGSYRVALDEGGHLLALQLDAQAQWGHVQQEHVLRHARRQVLAPAAAALLQNATLMIAWKKKRYKKRKRNRDGEGKRAQKYKKSKQNQICDVATQKYCFR